MVIVASDRMITSGDIQFEQQQPKIYNVAHNTLALISGDIAAQSALVNSTRAEASSVGAKTVREVARIFADVYAAYCRRKAEADVLKPLGLASVEELMTRRKWPAATVDRLLNQIQDAAHDDDVATIIAGQDALGAHLYVIERPGRYSVRDQIGFASIGVGQRHAESQFMFSGYTPHWYFPKALYLTYVAKKRAEVAPGVGKFTDLVVITGGPNGNIAVINTLIPETISILERVYQSEVNAITATRSNAEGDLSQLGLRLTVSASPLIL